MDSSGPVCRREMSKAKQGEQRAAVLTLEFSYFRFVEQWGVQGIMMSVLVLSVCERRNGSNGVLGQRTSSPRVSPRSP